MTTYTIISLLVIFIVMYYAGKAVGQYQTKKKLTNEIERLRRYSAAAQQAGVWCGHLSPEVKLIIDFIQGHGKGCAYNAGTPCKNELCDIQGTRTQLQRIIDAKPTQVAITELTALTKELNASVTIPHYIQKHLIMIINCKIRALQ